MFVVFIIFNVLNIPADMVEDCFFERMNTKEAWKDSNPEGKKTRKSLNKGFYKQIHAYTIGLIAIYATLPSQN